MHKPSPAKDLALISLHGMGKVDPEYAEDLREILARKLGTAWARVSFQAVQYAPLLQGPEEALWQAMLSAPENKLSGRALRQFLLFGFSDATSLEHSASKNPQQYQAVQHEIIAALDRALLEMGGDTRKPVVIVAQSLGCEVISNYLWDAQHSGNLFATQRADGSPSTAAFRALASLRNLVTTGCNIPLFIGGLHERQCFAPPCADFAWDNFYDPDDVLGWPLRQLGPSYEFVRDHPINAGGPLTSWNAMSHCEYWTDRDVLQPLADIVQARLAESAAL